MKPVFKLLIIFLIPALIAFVTYRGVHNFFFAAANSADTTAQLVEIVPGSTFSSFCHELEKRGIIRSWRVLDIIAMLKKNDRKVHAGEYELSPSMTPQQIMAKLTTGEVFKRIITVKEGMNIFEIAKALEIAKIIAADEFLRAVQERSALDQIGIKAASFEGYLFPETYQFSGKQAAVNVVWKMYEEFLKRWIPQYNDRLKAINFTLHEALTLASIIEKESGSRTEQPTISSVFHNRLKNGMRLESDPTVVYGLPDFNGVVLNKHKESDSPYNTYKNYGLPPGPICNPGVTAIEAALNPAQTEFLYFVADGQGGHVFNSNINDHFNAVNRYREMMRDRQKPVEGSAAGTEPAASVQPSVLPEETQSPEAVQ